MTSVVSICNMALAGLGKDDINSLDEASAQARACKRFYEQTRNALLHAYPWRFAGKTVALAEISNTEAGRWAHAYRYPTDCIRLRWVRPNYSTDDPCSQTHHQEVMNPFDIEGDVIFCNIPAAFARYTHRITDPARYPPLFVDALAAALALKMAMPLTRDLKVRADALKLAQIARAEAETADANEVRETSNHESEFIEVRG